MSVVLNRIWKAWEHERARSSYLRNGQALMNAVYNVDHKLYDELLEAANCDCYYNDDLIVYTLNFLQEKYGNK